MIKMNKKETRLLVESWRRLLCEGEDEKLYVYVGITPESVDSVMDSGLLNAVTLIKYKDKLKMARPDVGERKAFLDRVRKDPDNDSHRGISVFFGEPDWSKITEEHFIKKWDLKMYKIDLGRFLKDYPQSWVKGVELLPVIVGTEDMSDEDYDKYLERLGYDLSKGWEETKERKLSIKEIREYCEKSPKEMWKWYDVEEYAGKKYAANVPHGMIMSEIGRIPPEYIESHESNGISPESRR